MAHYCPWHERDCSMELSREPSSKKGIAKKAHCPLLWQRVTLPPRTHISPSVLLARTLGQMTTTHSWVGGASGGKTETSGGIKKQF